MPTISSASRQRSSACARGTSACVRMASIICSPMRSTGFSVISGSWKIIAMRSPRSWRICSSLYLRRSWPLKRTSPSTTSPGIDQAQQREAGHGLARAGLADQAHDFASAHGQVYAVDGRPGAGFGMECGAQAAHLQNGLAHVSHPLRKPPRRYRVSLHRVPRSRLRRSASTPSRGSAQRFGVGLIFSGPGFRGGGRRRC